MYLLSIIALIGAALLEDFYSPNISFTMRFAPRTNPVRISILKISCPIYSHAIVTAGRLVFTAGALLDRNAE